MSRRNQPPSGWVEAAKRAAWKNAVRVILTPAGGHQGHPSWSEGYGER